MSTTKPMKIICSWCKGTTEMSKETMIWNFADPSFADPIGYCSEKCCKQAGALKELMFEKAQHERTC